MFPNGNSGLIDVLLYLVTVFEVNCYVFPNLCTIPQILLTVDVPVASCERSFSKLKLLHSYLLSSMSPERLSNLAILSIEHEVTVTDKINFDDIILCQRKQNASICSECLT